MEPLRLFLDANVLVDAQLRDLLLRFAERHLVEVAWSRPVLEEVRRTLVTRLGLEAEKVDALIAALRRAFPTAEVTAFEPRMAGLTLPDDDDRHVLAAALEWDADLLVTFNVRDFPGDSHAGRLEVVEPDDALLVAIHADADDAVAATAALLDGLRRPPVTLDAFLDRLARRAPVATMALGAAHGVPLYERLWSEVLDAEHEDSPQAAVRALLDAVEDGDEAAVLECLTPEFATRIAKRSTDVPGVVGRSLSIALRDVFDSAGWGFATARRPKAPDVEVVVLVQGGARPRIARTPTAAPGHVFDVVRRDGTWLIDAIDGPPGERPPDAGA